MCISRTVLRWGLIGGLAVGGLALLVPAETEMALQQARSKAQDLIGTCMDDPNAYRAKIADLADDYPDRIAEVRGEIAEVDTQLTEFDHELDVARRVVAMTTNDLTQLKRLVERAETRMTTETGDNGHGVLIRYNGARYDIDEAIHEARRINDVRQSYRDRLDHSQQQQAFLNEQRTRLAEILDRLEREYTELQDELLSLDREIAAIERNERLIELTKAHEQKLARYENMGQITSIKDVKAQFARIRTEQEARLQALSERSTRNTYEERAVLELEGEQKNVDSTDPFAELETDVTPDAKESDASARKSGLAWSGVVIIE